VTSELLYDVQDKIAHIQINRPKQLNSINPPLMAERWRLHPEACRAAEPRLVL
jgi:enoyl-CoA hydratase/carnithine racemase